MKSMLSALAIALSISACNTAPVHPEPKETAPAPTPAPAPAPTTTANVERFGAPIDESAENVALTDVAKRPTAYSGKTFTTTGVVTAVCQHRGCWMEIQDDAGQAHVKMAGHKFFVPRAASGRKAKVLATLVKADEDEAACSEAADHGKGKGCAAEAEAQLGRPLAKLQLVAQGVELM